MYIAMNRFRIAPGREEDFENIWRGRQSFLDEVAGFKGFHLLKGPADDRSTLYSSFSTWESSETFSAWTESESFQKAHSKGRAPEGTYLGPPEFEGFEVVI
jgi:heme-degrading monooxygenase HmoA